MGPGPRNDLSDVPGLSVGSAEESNLRSGVTVVLPDQAAVAGVDVRGGAPGTRETDALDPICLVERVDALVLSGGSAFGLVAADAVMGCLAAQGRGFPVGDKRVPIVPAAILFDLLNGGEKDWGDRSPYPGLAEEALAEAKRAQPLRLGNAGAGMGAKAGPLKGGLGSASLVLGEGFTIAALVAVNSHGSAVMPGSDVFWAWPFERDSEFGGLRPKPAYQISSHDEASDASGLAGANTTLAVVACDAILTKAQAQRMAIMAQDGLARSLRPVHTPYDGDTVFALATGRQALGDPISDLSRLGAAAADCLSRAVARGVYLADCLGEAKSYRSLL